MSERGGERKAYSNLTVEREERKVLTEISRNSFFRGILSGRVPNIFLQVLFF